MIAVSALSISNSIVFGFVGAASSFLSKRLPRRTLYVSFFFSAQFGMVSTSACVVIFSGVLPSMIVTVILASCALDVLPTFGLSFQMVLLKFFITTSKLEPFGLVLFDGTLRCG